jgi:hypothetical protein
MSGKTRLRPDMFIRTSFNTYRAMKNHLIDVVLTPETLADLTETVATLNAGVAEFALSMDRAQRKHHAKLGLRNETFSRAILDLADKKPEIVPATIDVGAVQRDLAAREQLLPLLWQLKSLTLLLENTTTALGIDIYEATRGIYKAAKVTAGISGTTAVLQEIGKRFANQGRRKQKSPETKVASPRGGQTRKAAVAKPSAPPQPLPTPPAAAAPLPTSQSRHSGYVSERPALIAGARTAPKPQRDLATANLLDTWTPTQGGAAEFSISEGALELAPTDSANPLERPAGGARSDVDHPDQILCPRNVWIPHSLLSKPVQRPARSSSELPVALVHGQQPMER